MKAFRKKHQPILTLVFILLCAAVIIPFLMLVSISFSSEKSVIEYGYGLIPKEFSLDAYKYVFKNPKAIIDAYKVTAIFSISKMVLAVVFTSMIAYPLSRRNLKGRRAISFYLYFTMLFGGGLVPTYILITQYLHLGDTMWVYILPGLVSPWYVFMMRTFFQDLPEEMIESAVIDGAGEYTIYAKFIIPLSKPVLATIGLMTFLAMWNDWYTSMLYINKQELESLQYLLQKIMLNLKLLQDSSMNPGASMVSLKDIPSETVRMAMAIVVAGPALVVFPFFQKYFVRGLTVGSVKG